MDIKQKVKNKLAETLTMLSTLYWRFRYSEVKKMFTGCSLIMGAPGTGKSTLTAIVAEILLKNGIRVYSTEPIEGCLKVDIKSDPMQWFIGNGYLIIDEAGLTTSGRDWKSFTKAQVEFFKMHRHYKCHIIILSQDKDDSDKKMRQLATKLYCMQRTLLPFCVRCDVFDIYVGANENEDDVVRKYSPRKWFFGGHRYLHRSLQTYSMFDSWCRTELPEKDWVIYKKPVKT